MFGEMIQFDSYFSNGLKRTTNDFNLLCPLQLNTTHDPLPSRKRTYLSRRYFENDFSFPMVGPMWSFLGGVKSKPSQTNINWAMKWKRLFRVFVGDEILPIYMGIVRNHCKDPVINQPVVWWKVIRAFVVAQFVVVAEFVWFWRNRGLVHIQISGIPKVPV